MIDVFLSVTTSKESFKFFHRDIIRVEAYGPYSWIYAGKKKCCCCKHLKAIFQELKASKYLYKVHRSYIVNVDKIYRCIKKGEGYLLIMTDGSHIPVSKRKKSGFMKYYKRRKGAPVELNVPETNLTENKVHALSVS